jgi:hypothetical protein
MAGLRPAVRLARIFYVLHIHYAQELLCITGNILPSCFFNERIALSERSEPMLFWINCESDLSIDREPDEDSNGSESYFGHKFIVSKKKIDYPDETVEAEPGSVVLAIIYCDGNTFGYTAGLVEYLGPFTQAQADKIELMIYRGKPLYDYLNEICPGQYISCSWQGYFASLDRIEQIVLE